MSTTGPPDRPSGVALTALAFAVVLAAVLLARHASLDGTTDHPDAAERR